MADLLVVVEADRVDQDLLAGLDRGPPRPVGGEDVAHEGRHRLGAGDPSVALAEQPARPRREGVAAHRLGEVGQRGVDALTVGDRAQRPADPEPGGLLGADDDEAADPGDVERVVAPRVALAHDPVGAAVRDAHRPHDPVRVAGAVVEHRCVALEVVGLDVVEEVPAPERCRVGTEHLAGAVVGPADRAVSLEDHHGHGDVGLERLGDPIGSLCHGCRRYRSAPSVARRSEGVGTLVWPGEGPRPRNA